MRNRDEHENTTLAGTVNTWAGSGPVWCLVANMTEIRPYGPGGQETKHGSKHFAPGARLYLRCVMNYAGDPQIEVVGHHRGSHRYVTMIVSASWLTNWRVDLVYSPYVIKVLLPKWDGTPESKGMAEHLLRHLLDFLTK